MYSRIGKFEDWNGEPALLHFQYMYMGSSEGHYMWLEGDCALWHFWGFDGEQLHEIYAVFRVCKHEKMLYVEDVNYHLSDLFEDGGKHSLHKWGLSILNEAVSELFGSDWHYRIWFSPRRVYKKELRKMMRGMRDVLPVDLIETVYQKIWDGSVGTLNKQDRKEINLKRKLAIASDHTCIERKTVITYL